MQPGAMLPSFVDGSTFGDLGPMVPTACCDRPSILEALGPQARHRLHALHPAWPGQECAASGFGVALILELENKSGISPAMRPVLWVQDLQAAGEAGLPHGAGLAGLGLDPRRLLVVGVRGAVAALAAAEMGLEEAGLAGVLVDLPARLPADMLKLGKRLSLRAERQRTPCFLMHAGTAAVDAPVASRWTVASRPVLQGGALQGTAACPDMTTVFDVALTKNRFGALGRWSMAWRPEIGVSGISADIAQPGQFHASHQVSHQSGPTVQRFTFEAVTAPAVGRVAADSRLGSPGTAGWRRAA